MINNYSTELEVVRAQLPFAAFADDDKRRVGTFIRIVSARVNCWCARMSASTQSLIMAHHIRCVCNHMGMNVRKHTKNMFIKHTQNSMMIEKTNIYI